MKDPLYGNKVAAAVLIVALLAIGLPVVVGTLTELGEHIAHHDSDHAAIDGCPEGLVYAPFDCSALGQATAADEGPVVPFVNLYIAGDVARGERAAAICSSCHTFDKGGANSTGPNLWDVVGREVASHAGFSYTNALQNLGGVWSYDRLDPYLENSGAYVSGTAMAQKIRKDEKRADIIRYLHSLSDNPAPLPEPVEVEEEVAEAEGDDETVTEAEARGVEGEAMEEAASEAADVQDFAVPGPGEAVRQDDENVNNRGDDGQPGDAERTGSDYRSSNEDADADPNFDVTDPPND